MLKKTEAIVLGAVKYGDNSLVLKTYTAGDGLKTFIVGSIHSKKSSLRPAMIQSLTLLELVYYDKSKGELKRLKEASLSYSYQSLYFDPVKTSLAMFLAEVLSHVLKEEEANPRLFQFLRASLLQLDQLKQGLANFHLLLLYRLSNFLGFAPELPRGEANFFDLLNGIYIDYEPPHFHFLRPEEAQHWQKLHQLATGEISELKLKSGERSALLDALLQYYRLHVHDFGELRSLTILRDLQS